MNTPFRMWTTAAVMLICLALPVMAAPQQAITLTVRDSDGKETILTEEELRQLTWTKAEQCIWVGKSSGYIGIFDYAGARLSDVLKKAETTASAKEYRQENSYVIFRGTDGYQVIASWTELMESPEGRRGLIALEKNGAPLEPAEGKFRLVLPGDKYVGRSVKCLDTIEIHCADGFVELSPRPASPPTINLDELGWDIEEEEE